MNVEVLPRWSGSCVASQMKIMCLCTLASGIPTLPNYPSLTGISSQKR